MELIHETTRLRKMLQRREAEMQASQQRRVEMEDSIRRARLFAENLASHLFYSFPVTQFGVYNCDKPMEPGEVRREAKLVNVLGQAVKTSWACLVDSGTNSLFSLGVRNSQATLRVHPDRKRILWLTTADNRLGVVRPAALQSILNPGLSEPATVRVEISSKTFGSVAEARKFLGILPYEVPRPQVIEGDVESFSPTATQAVPDTSGSVLSFIPTNPRNTVRLMMRNEGSKFGAEAASMVAPIEWPAGMH